MPATISPEPLRRESPNCVCMQNISNVSLWMTDYPLMDVVRVTWTVFLNFPPIISLDLVKQGTLNVVCWLIQRCTSAWMMYYHRKGCVQGHVTFKFCEISDNISEMVQETWLQGSIIGNRMCPIEWHHCPWMITFAVWNLSSFHPCLMKHSMNLPT